MTNHNHVSLKQSIQHPKHSSIVDLESVQDPLEVQSIPPREHFPLKELLNLPYADADPGLLLPPCLPGERHQCLQKPGRANIMKYNFMEKKPVQRELLHLAAPPPPPCPPGRRHQN